MPRIARPARQCQGPLGRLGGIDGGAAWLKENVLGEFVNDNKDLGVRSLCGGK